MRFPFLYLLVLIFYTSANCFSQAIDNTPLQRGMQDKRYFRINYENDYFTRTDYYYTQGISLEWMDPSLRHFLLSRVLFHPKKYNLQIGVQLEQDAYTPKDYTRVEVQFGDRPFAAALFLKTFGVATDFGHKQKISSSISTGVIGPAAGGKEMQTTIHHWTNNPKPLGWHNQIANDLILNYQVNYQKQLFNLVNRFLITADGSVYGGTLNDKANIGISLMCGVFRDPFAGQGSSIKKIQIYAYEHLEWNAIGFDASLQGGILNPSSVYRIPAKNLSRMVFHNNWGIVMTVGRLYLEYSQAYLSREFNGGLKHRWGGILLGFGF